MKKILKSGEELINEGFKLFENAKTALEAGIIKEESNIVKLEEKKEKILSDIDIHEKNIVKASKFLNKINEFLS